MWPSFICLVFWKGIAISETCDALFVPCDRVRLEVAAAHYDRPQAGMKPVAGVHVLVQRLGLACGSV